MDSLHGHLGTGLDETCVAGADGFLVLAQVAHDVDGLVQLGHHAVGQVAQGRRRKHAAAERGSELGVQPGGCLAEQPGLAGEVRVGLVQAGGCQRPAVGRVREEDRQDGQDR